MHKQRFDDIDFLRAIAIIAVIVTHVLSYNLGTNLINVVWNYLHFIVPILVFCSGYVTYRAYSSTTWTLPTLITWYKKRIVRLVLPYYIIILLHYALWFAFPSVFSGYGIQKNIYFIIRSILFIGVDYGWLPLLFLELMLLTPLYLTLYKHKPYNIITLIPLGASSVALFFIHLPLDYRIVMWLPWSSILFLSFIVANYHTNTKPLLPKNIIYIMGTTVSLMIFLFLDSLLSYMGRQTTLTVHKYPPDIFYLSYGIGLGSTLLLLENIAHRYIEFLRSILWWLSTYSYELFFAHYLVIDILRTVMKSKNVHIPVILQCVLVLIISIEAVHIYTNIQKEIRNRKKPTEAIEALHRL